MKTLRMSFICVPPLQISWTQEQVSLYCSMSCVLQAVPPVGGLLAKYLQLNGWLEE
jgi:hypothetical protein